MPSLASEASPPNGTTGAVRPAASAPSCTQSRAWAASAGSIQFSSTRLSGVDQGAEVSRASVTVQQLLTVLRLVRLGSEREVLGSLPVRIDGQPVHPHPIVIQVWAHTMI
jgi:hypothetical protein